MNPDCPKCDEKMVKRLPSKEERFICMECGHKK